MASVWGELKRRNVVKVAVAYAIVGWILVEVSSTVLPIFEAPDWIVQVFTFFVILGFPLALILSWAYELTPEGIKADADVPRDSIAPATGQRLNYVIPGLVVLAVGFMFIDNYVLEEESEAIVRVDDRRSIAVLPFDNRSARTEDEFFVAGIHDDILSQLARIASLKVISRTSVMGYQGTDKNMRTIGEELGVNTILEGGVQRAGDTVRINVQLIDSETDQYLWAEIYDRELTAENIFAIQSEMATAIADALQATLLPQEVARLNEIPTQSTRAYDFYLSGNDYFRKLDAQPSFTSLALEMYGRAVEEDPDFALAWANLSRAQSSMFWYAFDRTESRLSLALKAVQRALELAPDLPEAHLAMGYYHYYGFRDYDNALREFAIAEQGMPGDAELFEARAYIYRRLGQWEQSLSTMARAIDLDPRRSDQLLNQAMTYASLRDHTRADQMLERVLEVAPDTVLAYVTRSQIPLYRDGDITAFKALVESPPVDLGQWQYWLGWIAAVYERDYESALQILDNWDADAFDYTVTYAAKASLYGVTYRLAGQPEQAELQFQAARIQLEELLEANVEDPRIYVALGESLAGLGEREGAIRAAYRAMELLPTSVDALWGPIHQLDAVVRVFVPVGDYDTALQELDSYLGTRGARSSIEGLLPDPRLDPIRDDPRFHALVEKYSR